MGRILLIHEDALLRAQHRKLLERHGHTVSEIAVATDQPFLPRDLVFDQVITALPPLGETPTFDSLSV